MYYVLAERFDADPFLIFTWRGRTQDELLSGLRARRRRSKTKAQAPPDPHAPPAVEETASFWASGPELADLCISPLAGEAPDALLRQLGPAPVATQGHDVADVLAGMYQRLAEAAERRALAE